MTRLCLVTALPMVTLFVIFAPRFLAYADLPRRSDAVVLFDGPGSEERLNGARRLIRDGYANYLIIPSRDEVVRVTDDGNLERISGQNVRQDNVHPIRKAAYHRHYFQDTHVEALEAKRILDEGGFKSAILVSSTYQMRRIKMIAGSVFRKGNYSLSFVPTRFQGSSTAADWLVETHRKMIVNEYLKIGWFLLYRAVGCWQSC